MQCKLCYMRMVLRPQVHTLLSRMGCSLRVYATFMCTTNTFDTSVSLTRWGGSLHSVYPITSTVDVSTTASKVPFFFCAGYSSICIALPLLPIAYTC